MADILRLGLAGLGSIATRLIPEVQGFPSVNLTAAADLRSEARSKFHEEIGGEVYETVEELCHSPNVDAVYIATPFEARWEHAVMAAQNGKHAIVAKPIALSIEHAEAMNQAAEANGVKLVSGHTHGWDLPIGKMREIIVGGEIGGYRMSHSWLYNNHMMGPQPNRDMEVTHGPVLVQGVHHVDVVRRLGGGLVRSVRGTTGVWDPTRPEGMYTAYIEFQNGSPATLVCSGYGFFDVTELHWYLGEGGQTRDPGGNLKTRRLYNSLPASERERTFLEHKERNRYGALGASGAPAPYKWGDAGGATRPEYAVRQPFFGLTIVSCERGEIRQSPDGIYIYGDEEKREVPVPERTHGLWVAEVMELYDAVFHDRPARFDGRWGEATLEVCLGILESARTREEVSMTHQVPVRD